MQISHCLRKHEKVHIPYNSTASPAPTADWLLLFLQTQKKPLGPQLSGRQKNLCLEHNSFVAGVKWKPLLE